MPDLRDLYGTCRLGPGCGCLRPGNHWLGRTCTNWQPIGFINWEGHKAWFDQMPLPEPPPPHRRHNDQ